VKLLFKNDACNEARDKYGCTALMLAAKSGHIEMVELLLKNNAKIEATDNHVQTALMLAARYGKVETVKLLSKTNARIEAKDTTSIRAARSEHDDTTDQLPNLICASSG
jgi:ankyrin repeat protein